jgi:hypothetical protein
MLQQIGVSYRVNPATTEEPADFVLFFQSYPYEFSRSELEHFRQKHPFAPFFFVLGVCCEGLLRTVGTLDSPFYCYVHGWSGTETEQIRLFLTDQSSVFSLPLTAEQDEIAQWENPCDHGDTVAGSLPSSAGSLPSSAVCRPSSLILTHFGPFGNDSAMNQLLADQQRQQGFDPEFCYCLPSVDCRLPIVADADDSPKEKILESIQRLRERFADNEFTVYVDSPRIDEKNDYLRAGVTQVLPKIRLLEEAGVRRQESE